MYGDIIRRLIEDETELAEKTKREIKQAIKEIKQGEYLPHEQLVYMGISVKKGKT